MLVTPAVVPASNGCAGDSGTGKRHPSGTGVGPECMLLAWLFSNVTVIKLR